MADQAPLGVYVHWPFCQAKCPYCDFNSHVTARIDQTRWARAYVSEIERLARDLPDRQVVSVFFGGGTPSLMDPQTVEETLAALHRVWGFSNQVEITLEANPTSVEADRFVGYRAAGVNRVSLGVQSLRSEDLKALGRLHDAGEARAALNIAQETFDRVSFDLIYARQHQSLADWREELREALELGVSHLSLYQLTIEPGTVFAARQAVGHLRGLPDEDLGADLYDLTQEMCDAAGLRAYEVSNHARPGQESQHNLIYWRMGEYVGIGPGAHGRLNLGAGRHTQVSERMPGAWLTAVEDPGQTPEVERTLLTATEEAEEYLMMTLRLSEGADWTRLGVLGLSVEDDRVSRLRELGLVDQTTERLRVTRKGRPMLNAILADVLT